MEFSASTIIKLQGDNYFNVVLNFVGSEEESLHLVNIYSYSHDKVKYDNIKSTIFLTKLYAISNNKNNVFGYAFSDSFYSLLEINTPSYFVFRYFDGTGLNCKISLLM